MDWIHPDFRERALARVRASMADNTATPWRTTKLLHKNGAEIDVEMQGVPITYLGEPAIQLSFLDITARKRSENTLLESEARFRALTELSSDWYWEQDENFRFIQISGNVTKTTGLVQPTYLGKTRWELTSLLVSDAQWDKHRALLNAHQEFRDFELSLTDTNNQIRWASISGAPIFDAQGSFKGYRGIGRDITAQKQSAEQIHNLAFYDALTNLPNRRLLLERLKKTEQLDARHQCKGALLFLDLDNFKDLNDTQGHDIGDTLLQQVAKRLVSCVREADNVARLGGDEFVVVLDDLHSDPLIAAAQADAVGRKILTALNNPYLLAGREHRSTTSIGITLFGGAQSSVEDQLKQADLALYQAKAAGRNTLRFFDEEMQSDVDPLVALESDLRDGLQGGEELALLYQPIVDINNAITGVEALVRWHQPERGVVMPETFIPLSEATGLILPLGKWVLQTACHQLALWAMRPETAHLTLAVNVSARQLHEPTFVDQVMQCLQRAGAAPQRLRLELTESVFINQVEDTIEKMNLLKAHGIGFSLDDFGTGYSSLSYLKRLPVDLIKIDRSFVRDVLTDPNDASIARTVVALGKNLGLSVVAEGVESEEQRIFLAENGCFAYQGYLYGAPMPIEKFDVFLQSRS
jgi:diguanylate cyclase (GGDEF)-like protein/PAS domain S-box-containing protein